jgi:nitrogen-specific signal transduction histidine kinase
MNSNERADITKTIISSENIRQRIASLFPDSVILDNHLRFISISQNISEATGYSSAELKGKPLSHIAKGYNLQEQVAQKLKGGYFEEEQFEICSKNFGSILYGISGFYLGMITDINGMIILKLKNLDEINLMYDRLEAKTTEIDRFVYLSAHALRGPLATMKGLINLTRLTQDPEEIKYLIDQIDLFSDKLDDKLHRLIYFGESDKGHESGTNSATLQTICQSLKSIVTEASVGRTVRFLSLVEDPSAQVDNAELFQAMLRNLVLFFCHQATDGVNNILLDIHTGPGDLEIILQAKGFGITGTLRERIKNINFGYSEILHYPEMINCYAAKKIVFKLRGTIHFVHHNTPDIVALITIPRSTPPAQ